MTDKTKIAYEYTESSEELTIETPDGKISYLWTPTNFSDCPEDARIGRGLITPQAYVDGIMKGFELAGVDWRDYVELDKTYTIKGEKVTKEELEDYREE